MSKASKDKFAPLGPEELEVASSTRALEGALGTLVTPIPIDAPSVPQTHPRYGAACARWIYRDVEPDLMDVPLLTDLAQTDAARAGLAFNSGMTTLARAIATTPETPADRVEALRQAFDATLADPALQAEAQKIGAEIRPLPGHALPALVERMVRTDPGSILP